MGKKPSTQLAIGPELPSDRDFQREVQIQQVVDYLAGGRSIKEACEAAGVSERTWRRWRKDGHVAEIIDAKFRDITSGVKDLVANALVGSTKVLTELALGKIPEGTSIDGKLSPRDVIAAQRQLIDLWEKLGGDVESKEREQERLLEELANAQIDITTVHVETVNIGDESQPVPVVVGATALLKPGKEVHR